jgi:signal transduction histidine kinase
VVAERTPELHRDGIRVIDELGPLPAVPADRRQLAQVFAHVLDNAVDAVSALPAGDGRMIRLGSRALPGRVRLRLENSGLPIDAEALPRIFDPFYTTKAVGRGAGLGLSVCRGIVSAHGGRIVAENLPQAVAIVIDLPAGDEAALPLDGSDR